MGGFQAKTKTSLVCVVILAFLTTPTLCRPSEDQSQFEDEARSMDLEVERVIQSQVH